MRSAATATALAAALALASPVRALAGPDWTPASGIVHAAWSWLAGLWGTPRETEPSEGPAPVWQKAGGCVDPLGHPCVDPIARPPKAPAPVWQKAGSCVDPSGKPVCQTQNVAGGGEPGGG